MIDDDWTLAEGDTMPPAWWLLPDHIRLVVRHTTSAIPGLPLIAFAREFTGSLSAPGPRYLDLHSLTAHVPTNPTAATARRAFIFLSTTFPETFSTVLATRSPMVWLALRLTRLTDAIADALRDNHFDTNIQERNRTPDE